MKKIGFLIATLLLISASCNKKKKNEECQWSHFSFQHPVSVYPVKESYNIGDTIWFEMNFSDIFNATVKNNYNGELRQETIQLKDFDFHRNFLRIFKLQDNTIPALAQENKWDAFSSIHISGNVIYENKEGLEYKLLYSNGTYNLKIGVICNETGNYLFSPHFRHNYPNAEGQLNEVDIRPECDAEHIEDIRFPVNKQSNGTYLTNYHLFEQFMNPELENDFDKIKNECFTFVVN